MIVRSQDHRVGPPSPQKDIFLPSKVELLSEVLLSEVLLRKLSC